MPIFSTYTVFIPLRALKALIVLQPLPGISRMHGIGFPPSISHPCTFSSVLFLYFRVPLGTHPWINMTCCEMELGVHDMESAAILILDNIV